MRFPLFEKPLTLISASAVGYSGAGFLWRDSAFCGVYRSMRKPVFKLFCLLLCVLVLEGCVHRQEVFLYDIGNHIYLIYEELGDTEVTITVTDCDDAAGGDLEVPAEIGGLQVISIGDIAFGGCSNLTSITIQPTTTKA